MNPFCELEIFWEETVVPSLMVDTISEYAWEDRGKTSG
jgi:hypothetical protein